MFDALTRMRIGERAEFHLKNGELFLEEVFSPELLEDEMIVPDPEIKYLDSCHYAERKVDGAVWVYGIDLNEFAYHDDFEDYHEMSEDEKLNLSLSCEQNYNYVGYENVLVKCANGAVISCSVHEAMHLIDHGMEEIKCCAEYSVEADFLSEMYSFEALPKKSQITRRGETHYCKPVRHRSSRTNISRTVKRKLSKLAFDSEQSIYPMHLAICN